MFLATINKPKQLLYINYIGHVEADELARGRENLAMLLADLPSGFRLLTDLSRLESITVECAAEIGKIMELCEQKGVELVIRIIPDPAKDIGLNILSRFHYHTPLSVVTYGSMLEASELLSL